MNEIYRHYGSNEFNIEKFKEIKNRDYWNKPKGGLWASSISAEYGWKDWCNAEDFRKETFDKYFDFKLENANILRIKNKIDAYEIEKENPKFIRMKTGSFYEEKIVLNFEFIKKYYDAIEIYAGSDRYLYFAFYGWDCDSIVILNKDKIKVVNDEI